MYSKSQLVHNDVIQAMIAENVDPFERPLRPTEDMLITMASASVSLHRSEKQERHEMKTLREFSKNLKYVESKSRAKTEQKSFRGTSINKKKKKIRENQDMRRPSGTTYCHIFPLPSAATFFDVCFALHPISKLQADMDRHVPDVGSESRHDTPCRADRNNLQKETRLRNASPDYCGKIESLNRPVGRWEPYLNSPASESVAMSPIKSNMQREIASPSLLPPVSPMKPLRKVKVGYGDIGSRLSGGAMAQGPSRPLPLAAITQNCDMMTVEELDGGPGSRLRPIKGGCIATAQRFSAHLPVESKAEGLCARLHSIIV